MSGKSDSLQAAYLDLLFLNIPMKGIGDAAGILASKKPGSLYFSLHERTPVGGQTASELSYDGYKRMPMARGAAGFSRIDNAVSIVSNVTFPACDSGSQIATHWGIGTSESGDGMLLYAWELSQVIVCVRGVTPILKSGIIVTES